MRRAIVWVLGTAALFAQPALKLTLEEAHKLALQNHPQIAAAQFAANAAGEVVKEVRSNYFPTVIGSVTGAGADSGSRIAAGSLTNPAIYNRIGAGVTVSQLIADFGRTGNLTQSARLHEQAQNQNIDTNRAEVILRVDRAYYSVLRARSVLQVARQTVEARQLVVDQVTALVQSKLKSNLDLSFASVNLAEAKLLLSNAENDLLASLAELANALGMPERQEFDLAEEPMPAALPSDAAAFIEEGIRKRPDLQSLRLEQQSVLRQAKAEQALNYPIVSAVGVVGGVPAGDSQVPGHYGAAALNLNIPVFNGGLYAARRAETDFRARAIERTIKDLENRAARDIRLAYLNSRTAFERLALTGQLLEQAKLSLDLARSRYDLGLGSIIELSQAQLNVTAAQIASAAARYDYQAQRSQLAYQAGGNL